MIAIVRLSVRMNTLKRYLWPCAILTRTSISSENFRLRRADVNATTKATREIGMLQERLSRARLEAIL